MTPFEGDVSGVPRSPSGFKLPNRYDGPFCLVLPENAASEELWPVRRVCFVGYSADII
jgi:hypothetical protein